ncbi:uncharacterized protein LOC110731466 [Chenopodium quinoa]|uniref:uncharacterized protein LOC110731466 n=1 Tax=Chenopodium quinoa TaxID=63459 RepID=UPI000B777073|nr:uncharacterized protein LOC110731466 [Chenopodium quinoa]
MASSTVQPIVTPSTTTTPLTTTSNQNQNQNQIPVVPNLPPQSQPPLSNNFNPKKRPLDHVYLLQSSPYFKMRAFIRDLRPLFLQVLRAPDFQNCEAARRIQEKMTLMVELCRHQTAEKVPLAKCNSGAGSLDFTNEKLGGLGRSLLISHHKKALPSRK